jgi:4-hydroxybenzoate polyprenyltransferase
MSIILASLVVAIGLMYSAPRISLKDRFVIKTLAIALALVLCNLMGSTASFGIEFETTITNAISVYAVLMLGTMVFITSPFNDLGDIAGDKAEGRRTIPIVIGRENTVRMAILLAISMCVISWLLYALSEIGLVMCILVNSISILTTINMSKALKKLDDIEFVRKQHKKSMPLHIMLQIGLIVGTLLI